MHNHGFELVCHRGARLWAPENTFASFDTALEMGGDILEFDVRQSKDGVFYILHDDKVDRTSDGTGQISEMSSEQIDALDAGRWFDERFEGECIPRLDAFFDRYHGKCGFYVEVKKADCARLCDLIRECGVMEDCYTCSFDDQMQADMHQYAPEMPKMVHWFKIKSAAVAKVMHHAKMMSFFPDNMTKVNVASAKALGMTTQLYCDKPDPDIYALGMELGIDQFNMDHLDLFHKVNQQRAA